MIFTTVWLGLAAVIWFNIQSGPVKLSVVGDYVAGMVAPLAFVWFIIAYFQQGEELKRNTEALSKQQKEMQYQAELLGDQASALRHAADALTEHVRPYVVASFETDGVSIHAVVKNCGARAALNVEVEFDPELDKIGDSRFEYRNVLQQSFMPPGREVRGMVTTTVYRLDQEEPSVRTIATVSYKDADGKKYRESYSVGLTLMKHQMMQPKSVSTLLNEMSKTLKETNKQLGKLHDAAMNLNGKH
ncbi:hypothetical protein CRI93_12405 [Longimonas halophila]|uniref:Uncharacterized protein n=1 Tax=Longimonas halophila TaxID=1469170 RepID=A0A2H3NQJ7_9BACT|nr:hypothetical protein CRI93_12405 [Longimonas halophila]